MSKVSGWFSSWRLLSWRTAVVVVFALYTVIGFVVVPWIAEGVVLPKVSEKLGSEITVDNISCNPFTLSLTVDGLSVPGRSGSPMLSFDEMYANLQASSLFRWAITLKELRVANPYAAVRRLPDGGINFLEAIDALKSSEDTPKEGGLPRVVVQEIRMTDGRFEVEDQARDEPLVWEVGPAQLQLNDISTIPGEEGDNAFVIALPGGGTIRIEGDVVVEPFSLDGSLSFDKILLGNVWVAIGDKFEFDLASGNAAADFNYHVDFEGDELGLEIDEAEFRLADLDLRTKDTDSELVEVASVTVSGVEAEWPEQRVRAESMLVDGASAQVWLEADGTPSWANLVPETTQDRIVETYESVKDQIDVDAKLGKFELRNASASFENRTFAEPHRIDVSNAELSLTEISTEPGSQWGLVASAAIGGESRASASGTFVALPVTLDAEVELENLELSPFQAYVEEVAPLRLLAGVLNSTGTVHLSPSDETGKITFQGGLAVQGLDLDETVTGGTLLGWGDLKVEGVEAALAPMSLQVAKADIYTAGLEIAVAEDGTINLLQFTQALGEDKNEVEDAAASSESEEASQLPPVRIGAIQLHDCYGVYKDATTPMPFERKLRAINGTVSNIATNGVDEAELEINAAVDSGGSVTVTGEMDIFEYARLTNLGVDISEVALPPMSPMSVKLIGYPIEAGRTSLDLGYEITDYQLQATNHVEVDGLRLGEKVEGEGKIKAPVKLGVSMLKDKNGRITLDIPMEGDLRDPGFVVASAISAAIAGVAGDLVKSPFRMLGRMVGGSDDQDLEFVDFDAGSAVLASHVTANLTTLAKALADRPELGVEVAGTFDPQSDEAGLREAALYRELGVEPGGEGTIPLRELESRLESETSASLVATARGQYMSDDGTLDEEGFRELLWTQLLEAQQVNEADGQALAPARAEAIRAYLVDQQGVDGSRVTVLPDTVTAETGDPKVRCQLSLTTDN